jgi:hypothetical protein
MNLYEASAFPPADARRPVARMPGLTSKRISDYDQTEVKIPVAAAVSGLRCWVAIAIS